MVGFVEETLRLRLSGGRDAPSRARRALSGLNGSLAGLEQRVRLLVSELVTNSVEHAGAGPDQSIEVQLTSSEEKVRVEVSDPGPWTEPPASRSDPGGFGLLLVARLADRWGVAGGPRKSVWFEIDRQSPVPA
jgi:anti-sigma regulatory factor (Ser/Thr protein kinase)